MSAYEVAKNKYQVSEPVFTGINHQNASITKRGANVSPLHTNKPTTYKKHVNYDYMDDRKPGEGGRAPPSKPLGYRMNSIRATPASPVTKLNMDS